ncbi:MAG: hypothetical protein IJL02_00040 [Methanobrevibacter sp.]|uniref:hypothetical protein n=1 Tax=Methanobrevibacter sp. TaxID=66852 RepID=UPI0025F6EB79|nr:hypothetical protein [Methanobrevibacter sp.]MBQ6098238.1 hypothetical protein [Methanobrevibacter sp.]
MKLLILSADNSKEMENIAEELSQKKFKLVEQDSDFILMRKRRYGNPLIHVVCLILALSTISLLIFINVGYFMYSYLWASPHVLITTEKVSDEGTPLEFNSMDEVLSKANAIL